MRKTYQVLAILIAAEVVIQAAAMVFAVAGLGIWVDGGGTLDKAAVESEDLSFTGAAGFMVHGMNGMILIPVLGLVLLVVSFFAKVPGGSKWAGITLLLIVTQVMLGILGHESAYVGLLHGLNAFALFSAAVYSARKARAGAAADDTAVAAA